MLYHHVDNNFHQFWSIDGDLDWLVMDHLGQTINNNKNQVIVVALPIS